MKRVFALYLMVCVGYAQEPMPGYTTDVPLEPEPDTTSAPPSPTTTPASPTPTPPPTTPAPTPTPTVPSPTPTPTPTTPAASGNETTTTTTQPPKHVFTVSATVGNLNTFANASDLLNQLKSKVTANAGASSEVKVVIKALVVKSTFGGFTEAIDQDAADDIAMAVKNMYFAGTPSITISLMFITVNEFNHSSNFATRRLQTGTHEAEVATTVPKNKPGDASYDVVSATKSVQAAISPAALTTQLQALPNAKGDFSNFNATMTAAPAIKVQMETTVTGQNDAPSTGLLKGGIADVLGVPESALSVDVVSTNVVTTPTPSEQENDHAPFAPMMTIWAVLYAFVMN